MLVGCGGNKGSTLTAAVLANRLRLTWSTRTGPELQPARAAVDLHGEPVSRPSVYIPEFTAANQTARKDNLIPGTRAQQLEQILKDIRDFRASAGLDKVIVLWTTYMARFCKVVPGRNDTAENLLHTIQLGLEVSPSTLFVMASILEGRAFLKGSAQNTLVPGALELAFQRHVFVGGDDFKSDQTKVKSVLVDFLIGSGLKTMSIMSYNHLGNYCYCYYGQNPSAPLQFRSKE
ncbi:hypothetical protein ACRRTK_015199 [Alexandromys fortis]